MKRPEILLGLLIALLAVCGEANERKNQRQFFGSVWSNSDNRDTTISPVVVTPNEDIFLEGGSGSKSDDEDDSLENSGDGPTNQNINLIDEDDDDEDSKDADNWGDDDNSDDEDFIDGSGSGDSMPEVKEVEDEIVPSYLEPIDLKPEGSTGYPLTPCQNLRKNAVDAVHFIPECDKNGAFKKLQCMKDRSRCWCVNFEGGEIPGTNKTHPAVPDCEFGDNLSTCVFQLVQHSQGMLGAYKPKCTLEGLYEPVQCQERECWCVDPMGNEVIGSFKQTPEMPNCEQYAQKKTTTVKTINIETEDTKGGYNVDPDEDIDNRIDVEVEPIDIDDDTMIEQEEERTNMVNDKENQHGVAMTTKADTFFAQPGLLAAIIGATVVGLLLIVLLVMFVVYRMRKKDEGSYPLEEQSYPNYQYTKAPEKEFYA